MIRWWVNMVLWQGEMHTIMLDRMWSVLVNCTFDLSQRLVKKWTIRGRIEYHSKLHTHLWFSSYFIVCDMFYDKFIPTSCKEVDNQRPHRVSQQIAHPSLILILFYCVWYVLWRVCPGWLYVTLDVQHLDLYWSWVGSGILGWCNGTSCI